MVNSRIHNNLNKHQHFENYFSKISIRHSVKQCYQSIFEKILFGLFSFICIFYLIFDTKNVLLWQQLIEYFRII